MTRYDGCLRKMKTELTNPVSYQLPLGDHLIALNPLLGRHIAIKYQGVIHCIQCGRHTKKSFQQGHCFPCMQRINECNNCMLHPERCLVEEGKCSKDDWAHIQCHENHVVYLANSSGLKVGITRHNHIPSRWIDQGAIQALPIFGVSNRYQAGLVEVALKRYVNDKTNWRKMLKNEVEHLDLIQHRDALYKQAEKELAAIQAKYQAGMIEPVIKEASVDIHYPVQSYPDKIVSLSLDKTPEVAGVLVGIKGQYWIFDCGVINIRKFGGYHVELYVED